MGKIKCLVVGSGGREASIIEQLKNDCILYAFMSHENPGIIEAVNLAGGEYIVGNTLDGKEVSAFATKNNVEIGIVSNDNILEAGVVDALRNVSIPTFGATREGAKIEWSKTYALNVVEQIAPQMNIKTYKATNEDELKKVIDNYQGCEFVVKPDGLTGGKGVKVGNDHFKTKEEGYEYAKTCLESSGRVIIQDIIKGTEFTVMGFTDGKNLVLMPITYDYPYRFDGDTGPGTGGMGCITYPNGKLPFLNDEDIAVCKDVMEKAIRYMNKDSVEFTGVLYGGFFKCSQGIKIIEFNSRFGDPECLNIMELLDAPLIDIVKACINGTLTEGICKFKKNSASIIVYLVTKSYALDKKDEPLKFYIDQKRIEELGGKVIYSSCIRDGDGFIPTGASRLAAVVKSGESLPEIRKEVYKLIDENVTGELDFRREIGTVRG